MPSQREHVRLSREYLGRLSLGGGFQTILDEHAGTLGGPLHRGVDHTWGRMNRLAELYGPVGYAEILIHLGADYGLIEKTKQ